jgi:hypothetical protein
MECRCVPVFFARKNYGIAGKPPLLSQTIVFGIALAILFGTFPAQNYREIRYSGRLELQEYSL